MRMHPYTPFLREIFGHPTKSSEKVLEHIGHCPKCQERFALIDMADRIRPTSRVDYGPALEQAYRSFELRQAVLGRERVEAPDLLAHLLNLVPERQRLLLRNSRRYQKWGLFELLMEEGAEETFTDPSHAEELLQLALEVASLLDPFLYGKERVEDMRGRTLGYIGNARRVKMDLGISEEAFQEAFQRLCKGTGDIMERALLFDLQASLRRAQRRLDEALQLSSRAIAIYMRVGQIHQAGKSLVKLATIHHSMGNNGPALSALWRSFDLLDPLLEPRVALCALHNLTDCLLAAGQLMKAQRVFTQTRPLYQRFPEPGIQNRRLWVEGRMASRLGHYDIAKALLTKARDGFISIRASFEANLVSRDIAELVPRTS